MIGNIFELEQKLKSVPFIPGDPNNQQMWQMLMRQHQPAIVAGVLNEKQKEYQAAQAEAQKQQMGGQQPTVIEGLLNSMAAPPPPPSPQAALAGPPPMGQGIASMGPMQPQMPPQGPQRMAGGGIVAFADGGNPYERSFDLTNMFRDAAMADEKRRRSALGSPILNIRSTDLDPQTMADREALISGFVKPAAAAADIFTLPVRGVMGAVNTALRIPRALGLDIPFIPEAAFGGSSSSLTPYYDKYVRAKENNLQGTPAQSTHSIPNRDWSKGDVKLPEQPKGVGYTPNVEMPDDSDIRKMLRGMADSTPGTYFEQMTKLAPKAKSAAEWKAEVDSIYPSGDEWKKPILEDLEKRKGELEEGKRWNRASTLLDIAGGMMQGKQMGGGPLSDILYSAGPGVIRAGQTLPGIMAKEREESGKLSDANNALIMQSRKEDIERAGKTAEMYGKEGIEQFKAMGDYARAAVTASSHDRNTAASGLTHLHDSAVRFAMGMEDLKARAADLAQRAALGHDSKLATLINGIGARADRTVNEMKVITEQMMYLGDGMDEKTIAKRRVLAEKALNLEMAKNSLNAQYNSLMRQYATKLGYKMPEDVGLSGMPGGRSWK